ncbi:MAG: ABC transporter ATP-binding protein [Desulfuromonadales bacterium]|nr:ABC transporter ATP-binding protein [Desulfuromonadales bacterium]MBN2791614.1 ABC transporter ATP-binding protein [Desulfuromonadales bacterium]
MSRYLQVVQKNPSTVEQPYILDVEHVQKKFGNGDIGEKLVLADIGFSARRGELICILGRSGCGKTTLLNLLAGFIAPDQGTIRLHDQPVSKPGPDRCVVFQDDALFPWLTVRENIAFGLKGQRISSAQKEEEIDRFLKLVGLSEFAAYLPSEISGGMKQRVALARVLILKPQVLLMDEPFAALDAQTREEMQNLVLELWQQLAHTILFVTHDVTEAVLLADRILLFDKDPGRIKEDIRLELSRPREKEDQNFLSLCRVIRAQI